MSKNTESFWALNWGIQFWNIIKEGFAMAWQVMFSALLSGPKCRLSFLDLRIEMIRLPWAARLTHSPLVHNISELIKALAGAVAAVYLGS